MSADFEIELHDFSFEIRASKPRKDVETPLFWRNSARVGGRCRELALCKVLECCCQAEEAA